MMPRDHPVHCAMGIASSSGGVSHCHVIDDDIRLGTESTAATFVEPRQPRFDDKFTLITQSCGVGSARNTSH
jgi:hypothetical protein